MLLRENSETRFPAFLQFTDRPRRPPFARTSERLDVLGAIERRGRFPAIYLAGGHPQRIATRARGRISTTKRAFVDSVRGQRIPVNIMVTHAPVAGKREKRSGIFECRHVYLLKAKLKRPLNLCFIFLSLDGAPYVKEPKRCSV